uniref:Glycosyltransferase N-terminal domain-containing protein n=2 Tax=Oryza TaxID=4527 RepID=A0A0E0CHG1_9ORYZ
MAPTAEPDTATPLPPPHFVIVPFPAQGHTIPMVDLARLLAERGARASLVVTPVNAARLRGAANHAARAKLPLEIVEVPFPPSAADAGLPPGVENIDQITDYAHFRPFFDVMRDLAAPLEAYLRALPAQPSCVISDLSNSWTAGVASRVGVPRLFFHGPSCFYSLCDLNAAAHGLQQQADDDRYVVPGMPVRVEPDTATPLPPPHFVIVPFPAQGHTIPMVDLARLLAERGARASLVVTPVNAARLRGAANHAARAKLPLEIVEVPFPPSAADAGLPPGVENIDQITDYAHFRPFFDVMRDLAAPLEAYLRALPAQPSCVISDLSNSWTAGVASRVGVPRLFFHGPSCFYSLCDLNAAAHGLQQQADDDRYVVPGMPVRVEVTKDTQPGFFNTPGWEDLRDAAMEAMRTADGGVVNTFLDLEDEFIACYEAALAKPVWTLGPFCLYNRDADAMASRGNTPDVAQSAVTTWLDAMDTDSVTYVNFGTLACKVPKYLFEVGHGLEDSGKPFIWVVKESEVATPEVQEWLSALEARVAARGVVVRGWAPQLAILSHRAVGGFVTHCGWNSILESIAHGVPVVTWPHFTDQFLNERLAVDVLGVGAPVGATAPVMLFGDEAAMQVGRADVARAVSKLMDGGEEAGERRRKAKEYGEKAHRAMEKGGSSYESLTQLIRSFTLQEPKNSSSITVECSANRHI